jgi:hypothetical protein
MPRNVKYLSISEADLKRELVDNIEKVEDFLVL